MTFAPAEKGKMMSRWIVIDADVIPNIYTATHQELIFALEDALGASIDIVHCRECTERDDDWCMYFGKMTNPDDFCSYGERSGE